MIQIAVRINVPKLIDALNKANEETMILGLTDRDEGLLFLIKQSKAEEFYKADCSVVTSDVEFHS